MYGNNCFRLFNRNYHFLRRDPPTPLKIDETPACFTRSLRVVITDDMCPLVTAQHEYSYVTGVFCANAIGFSIRPMVIVEDIVHLQR